MLEFYYTYHQNKFQSKSMQLADELLTILKNEKIKLESTEKENIPKEYRDLLDIDLFNNLNNIYFTIRQNDGDEASNCNRFLFTDYSLSCGKLCTYCWLVELHA